MASRPGMKKNNSAKAQNMIKKAKIARKGNPNQNGNSGRRRIYGDGQLRSEDIALSKAISTASEAKVAAKLLQSGSRLTTVKDVQMKGKEINREKRRGEVKKRESRVEQKLKELKILQDKKENRGHDSIV